MVRTRASLLVYAMLGFYGWFIYGFGPVVPLIRDEQGLTSTVAGLHSTALAVGALVAGGSYPALARWLGRGRVMWLSMTGLAGGVLGLTAMPATPWATVPTALFCGTFGSLLVTGVAPVLRDAVGPDASGPALSEANAMAAGAGLLAPLPLGATLDAGLGWRPAMLVVAVLAAMIAMAATVGGARLPDVRRARPPTGSPASPADRPPAGPATGRRTAMPVAFWPAWAVVLCCVGTEFCTTLWASDVVRARTGAGAALATAAITAVIAGMFAGRLVGARLAARHPGPSLLLGSLAVALAGVAVFWLSSAPVPAVVGLALSGLGLGPLFPLSLDLAMTAAGERTDRAAGLCSAGAGLAIGGGPFALGALADQVGPHLAFLIVPALYAVAAAGVLIARRAALASG